MIQEAFHSLYNSFIITNQFHKIVLGGCCVSNDSPTWKCVDCGAVIHKLEIYFKDSAN